MKIGPETLRQQRPALTKPRKDRDMAELTFTSIDESVKARFWSKVHIAGANDCWTWTGSRSQRGYGAIKIGGMARKASHVALILDRRPRPSADAGALHTCDNPPCCNPAHLFWGTQADNVADASKKGRMRSPRGEQSPRTKITQVEAREIRESTLGCVALGKKYGISPSHASNLRKGRRWSHI